MKRLGYLLLLLLVLIFAGCGGGSDSGGTSPDFSSGGSAVTPGSSSVGTVTLSGGGGKLIANGTDYTLMTVTVLDTSTPPAPLSGQTVTFTTTAGSLSPSSATTNADGEAFTNLVAGLNLGNATVTATAGGTKSAGETVAFVEGPAAVMVANAVPLVLAPTASTALEVFVEDAYGHPLPGETVTFSSNKTSGNGAGFSSIKATTDNNGRAIVTYKAGSGSGAATDVDTLTAISTNGTTASIDVSVTASAVVLETLTLTTGDLNNIGLTADGISQIALIATATNSDKTPAQGVPIVFSTELGSIVTTNVTTDSNGVAISALQAPRVLGSALVRAVASNLFIESTTVECVAGPPRTITLSAAPATIKPTGTTTLTATVLDANNLPRAGEVVNFSFPPTGIPGSFSSFTATTNANGQAFVTYTAGDQTGTAAITGRTSSNSITGSANVTVTTSAAALDSISLFTGSSSVRVGEGQSVLLRATIVDAEGQAVPSQPVDFTTSLGVFGTDPSVSLALKNLIVNTDNTGVAKIWLFDIGTVGIASIVANADGLIDSVDIGFIAGSPATVTLSAAPNQVQPTGTSKIIATVVDAGGNAVSAETVNFIVPAATNQSGGTIQTSAVTDPNGQATVTYTAGVGSGAVTDNDRIKATVASNAVSGTFDIKVSNLSADLDTITLVAGSTELEVGGTNVLLRAEVKDTLGNPVTSQNVDFTTTLGLLSNDPNVAPSPGATSLSVNTDAAGVARVYLFSDTTVGTASVVANASGLIDGAVVSFKSGPPATVTVTAAPITIKPTGSSTMTATVVDANNNPVVGETVNFIVPTATNQSGGVVAPVSSVTDGNGQAKAVFTAGDGTGTDRVNATARTNAKLGFFDMTVSTLAADLDKIVLEAGSDKLQVNGKNVLIRAKVTDTEGNPVTSQTVDFTTTNGLFSADPTVNPAATANNLTATTDTTGVAKVYLFSPAVSGSALVVANAGGLIADVSVSFIAGAPSLVTVSAVPGTVKPEGSALVVATVTDVSGNPVVGETVNFIVPSASNVSGATVSPASAVTDGNGQARSTYSAGATVGTDTLQATAATNATNGVVPIVVSTLAADLASIELFIGSTSLQVGAISNSDLGVLLTATVKDTQGNPVVSQTVKFTTTLGEFGDDPTATDSVTTLSSTTNAQGVAKIYLFSTDGAGSARINANAEGLIDSEVVKFIARPPNSVTVTGAPATVKPNGNAEIRATVIDSLNNPVVGETVSFLVPAASNASGATLAPVTAVTNENGQAVTTYKAGSATGSDTVRATATTNATSNTAVMTVSTLAADLDTIDLFIGSNKLVVGGITNGISVLLRATVKDTEGNLVTSQSVDFSTTLGELGITPTVSGGAGTLTGTTDSNGVARVYLFSTDQTGSAKIIANADGLIDSVVVDFVAGPPSSTVVSATPTKVKPTGTARITATVKDANFYPLVNELVVFSIMTDASVGASLSNFTGMTNENGQAFTDYTAGSGSGTPPDDDVVQATASSNATSGNVSISVDPSTSGFLNSIELSFGATSLIADSSNKVLLRAIVLDNDGDPAPSQTVAFSSTLGTLSSPSALTDNNGIAEVTLTAPNTVGTAKVTAETGGFTSGGEISFVAGPVFVVTPVATPNPVAAAGSSILHAYTEDKNGNRIAGTTLNFYLDDADVEGALDSYALVTDGNGRVTTTYRAGNIPGVYNTVVIAPNAVSASKLITVDANLSVGSIALDIPYQVVPTGAAYNSVVTATVLDSAGQPLYNVAVTPVLTGTATSLPATIANTDGDGQTTFKVTDNSAENVTLSVTAGGKVATAQLYFGATLSIVPNSVTVTGSTTLTALLKDATLKPLSGQGISFALYNSVAGSDETLSAVNTQTLPDGTAKVDVIDTAADGDVAKVVATVGALTSLPATVNFQPNFSGLTLTATSTSAVQATGSPVTVTVKATDAAGLPFEGVPVSYNSTGRAVLGATSGTTNANGIATFTVNDAVAENVTVTVASGTTSVDVPLYFGARLTLTPTSTTGVADGATPVELTATVKDAGNAAIAGVDVYFQVTSGYNSTLSIANTTTDASGKALVQVINRSIETTKVQAQAGSLSATTSTINFEASVPASMVLTTTSNSLSLGGVATITATVTDILGNNVADDTEVTFSTSSIGIITAYNSTTNGVATVQFNAGPTAGSTVITATAGSVTKTLNLSVLPGAAGVITVESITPPTIHILGTTEVQNAIITFRVTDGSGNNVAEGTPIDFALDTSAVGGETLYNSASSAFERTAHSTTSNGLASVTLRSGIIAGPIDVIASVTGTGASSLARVIVVGALPDSMHMDMSSSWLNLSSYVINNLEAEVMVNIGDRFGNVPIDGTPVSFYAEPGCGTIGTSAGFIASTESGVARATFRGIITPDDNTLRGHTYNSAIAQKGLCTLLATTTGAEFFYDNNGDGIYNSLVDTCAGDQGEPYVDANDNGSYDPDEFYVDINNNGSYDVADGICQANTTIWTEGKILLSSWFSGFNPSVAAGTFASTGLAVGEGQTFTFDFEDLQGNSLVAGSSFTVEADGGKLYGNVSKDQGDTTATGGPYSVTLYSDSEADAKPKLVEIKWTYTAAGNADSPGSNPANLEYSLVGWINIATSAYPIDSVEVSTGAEKLIADGTSVTLLRASVTDTSGAAVYNSVVTFSVTDGTLIDAGDELTPTNQAVTDSFGNATIIYRSSTTPGTVEFAASIGGVNGVGSLELVTGPADSISVNAAPKTLLPGAETTVSAIVRDATLNPIKDATVFFSIQTNNSDGAFNVTGAKTDEFGVATATYTAGTTLSAASVIDTLQAASGGLVPVTVNVTVSTAGLQIDTVELSAGASSLRADGASTTSIYATVKDADGNPVPFVNVSFASQNSEFNSLITANGLTDAAGVATVTYTAGDTTGTDTVTATVGGVSAQLDITLVPGAATGLTLTPSDAGPVDPRATVTYTAAVKDANNNPVPNQVVLFSITTNNSSAALSAASATTDANGLATVIYTAGTKTDAGTADDTVTATLGALNTNHTLTVTNDNTVVNEVGVTAASATIVSDNTTSTAVRALLLDTNGYTVPSGISVTFSTSVGQISADNATWGTAAVPVTTNVAGIATVYIKGPNPIALGTTVVSATATVDGVAGSTTVDFVAGSPDSVTLSLSATSVIPGESVTLTATVQDSNSLVIKDETVTFIYNTIGSTGTLTSTTAVTDSSGLATVTFVAGSADGTDGFKARAAAVTSTETTLTVDPTLTPIGGLTLTAANDAITADGVTETLLRANVVDRNGTAIQDVDVAFSTNIGGLYNSATSSYNSAIAAVKTNSLGDAEILLRSETTPGTALVTANIGGFNAQTTVTFVPGGPVLANSEITAYPSTIPADGISTSEITVFLADTNGNPVSDDTEVTLIYTRGTLISENPAKTISGRAVFTLQAPSTPGGDAITLSIVELSGETGTLNVGAAAGSGSPEPANMLLSVGKSNISVAGVGKADSTTLTIEIFKDNGAYIDEDDFALDTLRVQFVTNPGGGEYISGVNYNSVVQTLDDSVTSIDVASTDGIATLNFFAGNLPGVIEVLVTALDTAGNPTTIVAALPQLTISSGPPHTIVLTQESNSITNLGGGVYRRSGTAIVTDRYGNSVPDDTALSLGLVDSLIAYYNSTGVVDTITNSAILADNSGVDFETASIIRNGLRKIQNNDRVLLLNAPTEDRSRFVDSVESATTLRVRKDYQNDSPVGNYHYLVGSSLLGGFISGEDADANIVTGQATTKDGLARFYVTYPVTNIFVGCQGYSGDGPESYPTTDTRFDDPQSAQVYVVAAASDNSAATINRGEFCYTGVRPVTITVAPKTLSGDDSVDIQVEDANGVRLPFVPLKSSVVVTNREETFACTDPTYTDEATCTAAGTCSDGVSASKTVCEAVPAVWTAEMWQSTGFSDFGVDVDFNGTVVTTDDFTDAGGLATADITVTGVNTQSGDAATITIYSPALNASEVIDITLP